MVAGRSEAGLGAGEGDGGCCGNGGDDGRRGRWLAVAAAFGRVAGRAD